MQIAETLDALSLSLSLDPLLATQRSYRLDLWAIEVTKAKGRRYRQEYTAV